MRISDWSSDVCSSDLIATVAVYSDADARAPHVLMADERVRLGQPPAAESYLLADLILAAARETGADAIHPVYGFLSERERFARACAEAGIAFIGDRKHVESGQRVSVRLDPGGRRIIQKHTIIHTRRTKQHYN